MHELIYHLAPLSTLRRHVRDGLYTPPSLASEGFVHLTSTKELVLDVACDYFADLGEPLLVLAVDPSSLRAALRFEPPAPIAGSGTRHLRGDTLFPHLYGALELDAITGAAELPRAASGFGWPAELSPLSRWLATSLWRRDDNGNELEMARDLQPADAERLAAEYEARGHKQDYWTAPTRRREPEA